MKTEQAFVFADAHPISKGHTLVVPSKHVSSIAQLCIEEQKALWEFVGQVRHRC
jgi:diadenosine tetraphosphate (Ap4A) HIT family hydrolase